MMHMIFFFNDTATTEIYTLSLHDALPIYAGVRAPGTDQARAVRADDPGRTTLGVGPEVGRVVHRDALGDDDGDRKSTRLNSSHANISYAVFCLKKKK